LFRSKFFPLFFQALELIENEKVKISKKNLKEIIDLVRKEHIVEKIEEMEAKAKQEPPPSATKNI
jgi:hypothetical protein